MRKLIASINVTVDGFMAGPNCELDWHFSRWTPEMADAQCEQLRCADTILLGGVTYTAMAAYWPVAISDINFPRADMPFADMMNSKRKVVCSRTITTLYWENSERISGNLSSAIYNLKTAGGNDIIIYGSGKLIGSLMRLGLIDEYALWLHPVLLGNGKPLFGKMREVTDMRLLKTRQFSSGVMLLQYKRMEAQ